MCHFAMPGQKKKKTEKNIVKGIVYIYTRPLHKPLAMVIVAENNANDGLEEKNNSSLNGNE